MASEPALTRPRVSVVIPTRNRVEMLRAAVASALQQTERDLEVIVVDDGSTDGTAEYLQSIAVVDPRVHPIYNATPKGGAGARNVGIAAARGEWIAFLDDDDEWLPRKLALQLTAIRAYGNGVVACSSSYFVRRGTRSLKLVRVPPIARMDDLLRDNVMGGASLCLCRGEVVKTLGGYDAAFRSGQDWDLWTRLSEAGDVIACAEPTVIYNEHSGPRISHDGYAQYQGGRCFYFKYRKYMTAEIRQARLAYQSYLMSRQDTRSIVRRVVFLATAMRAAQPRGLAVSYLRSSAPRILRDLVLQVVRRVP